MSAFTVPTYEVPIQNELGRHGVSFPRSYTVVIASGVATAAPGASGLVDPDGIYTVADAGSGEAGLAVFLHGKAYTVTAGEETILTTAGYAAYLT